jgi:DNA polymerase III alpha subunit (gram-positive type)
MTFSADTVENTPIDASPACPKCSALMDLASIEPGFDLRTFECPTCQHVETVVVKFR